jgi:probable rRNA maturation factor
VSGVTLQLEIAVDAPSAAFDGDHARALIEIALADFDLGDGQIDLGLHLVDEHAIRTLNRDHRHSDSATDVLSFPIDGTDAVPPGMPRQLGDIFVCPTYISSQLSSGTNIGAGDDATLERAIQRCIVHGMLHLLGMDHRDDREADAMRDREDEMLARLDGTAV